MFLHCRGWYDKNNQSTGLRSVREAPLCLIYIRISLGTVSFEQKGGEAVGLSYGGVLICEFDGTGRNREILHEIIVK